MEVRFLAIIERSVVKSRQTKTDNRHFDSFSNKDLSDPDDGLAALSNISTVFSEWLINHYRVGRKIRNTINQLGEYDGISGLAVLSKQSSGLKIKLRGAQRLLARVVSDRRDLCRTSVTSDYHARDHQEPLVSCKSDYAAV